MRGDVRRSIKGDEEEEEDGKGEDDDDDDDEVVRRREERRRAAMRRMEEVDEKNFGKYEKKMRKDEDDGGRGGRCGVVRSRREDQFPTLSIKLLISLPPHTSPSPTSTTTNLMLNTTPHHTLMELRNAIQRWK